MSILALALLAAVLWLVLRARPEGAPPGDAREDDLVDDMQLHDETNPGDDGDVGDTTDGR
ncbi:MAG TPA: hypothetical protein VND21_07070 [Planctomycetota bacterium]|nr:hypothetical protein [Planctomycetota bacterium]